MATDLASLITRVHARRSLPSPAIRKATRVDAGSTQEECAVACGVSRQAFAYWESGERAPSGDHLYAYLALLGELQQAMAA